MQTFKFDVHGMISAGCTMGVQRALSKIDGVSQVNVSLQPDMATVKVDPAQVTSALIEAVIFHLGYQAKLRQSVALQGANS